MKRQIKFRAWTGERMIFPDYINRDGFGCWKENSIPSCTNELMQFTGLLDKNGKDIYESSVLNKKTTFENNMADRRFQLATQINVGFENGCFIDKNSGQALFDALRTISSYPQRTWTDYEIIGNELENPELL